MNKEKYPFLQMYVLTMADMSLKESFRDQCIALHRGQIIPHQLSLNGWNLHLMNLVSVFTKFAKQLPLFQSLCLEDQTTLVTHNAFLFVQYLLGKFCME